MAKGAIRIDWYPSDALDGMKFLTPTEELAYRRILDLLYISGGELPDDDAVMAEQTRTFKDWKKVRLSLLSKGKIVSQDGKITNDKATEVLTKIAEKMEKASAAGRASGASRRQILPTKNERTFNERINESSTDAPIEREPSQLVNKLVKTDDDSASADDWPELGDVIDDLVSSSGLHRAEWQAHTASEIVAWRRNGFSYRLDVVPSVARIAAKLRHQPRSWAYFTSEIAQSYANRTKKIPVPESQAPPKSIDPWDQAIADLTGEKAA